MNNWTSKPLGDLLTFIQTGSTPSTDTPEYFEGSIPWFTPSDIGVVRDVVTSSRNIGIRAIESGEAKLYSEETLLVTCIGNIGRVGITRVQSSYNQQITGLGFDHGIDVCYAYYWFIAHQHRLEENSNHAIVPILNNAGLKRVAFSYPPLAEQRRIAAILRAADDERRRRRYTQSLSDGLLREVFVRMFGDPATNPLGWEVESLEGLGTKFIYGTSEKCTLEPVGLPVLRIPNVLQGSLDLADLKYAQLPLNEAKKITLEYGDLVFVRTNGNPDYVGRVALFDLTSPFLFASYLIRGRLRSSRVNPVFVHQYLMSAHAREQMQPAIRTTAGQSNIGIDGLGNVSIPIPSLELQCEFATIVAAHEQTRRQQQESARQSDHLFATLLHRAFAGEL